MEFDFGAFKELKKEDIKEEKDWQICENCNVSAIHQDFLLVCPECGVEIQNIDSASENYSYCKKSNDITKIEGKNSYTYNKSLRTTCSNYSEWNKAKSIKKLNKFSYETKAERTPEYVNKQVIEQFEKIRKIKTFRGTGQNRVLAAISYYIMKEEGLIRQPRSIAELHGLSEKDLSKGDSIVRQYIEEKVIDLPVNHDVHELFIDKYLSLLNIDADKYKKIILEIIERGEKKRIYRRKTPKPSTKCVGSIYLIIRSDKSLSITKEEIINKCNISKTTFISNYQLLLSKKKIYKKIYQKYSETLGLIFPEC